MVERAAEHIGGDIGCRPVGTDANEAAQVYLEGVAARLGYEIRTIPFECRRWEFGESFLRMGDSVVPIHPGPFSPGLGGEFDLRIVESVDDLRDASLTGELIIIRSALAEEPLMPKDFPFYYPEENREIVDLLQNKRPAGIIALTGKHPLCGLDPYPLFEDGNLGIPNAYAHPSAFSGNEHGTVKIVSSSLPARGRQLLFSRAGRTTRRVLLCAHIDTKYETPGALDNAAGVAALLGIMERLAGVELPFCLDVAPFNGEEYYGVDGQLAYLDLRKPSVENTALAINLDALGYRGSVNAFSTYNLTAPAQERLTALLDRSPGCELGEPWVAGDHSIFAFQGISSIAVSSSNLLNEVMGITHTQTDTLDKLDVAKLEEAADAVAEIVRSWAP